MLKRICFVAVLLLALLPLQAVATEHIGLSISADKSSYATSGSVDIKVKITNPSTNWKVSGVTVSATGDGLTFSYSPSSIDISADGTASFIVTATGFVWVDTDMTISVAAPDTDNYSIDGDSTSVTLRPPKMGLDVVYPQHEMTIPVDNVSETRTVSFDAIIKNTGTYRLEGVSATLTFDPAKINCTSSGAVDIETTRNEKISISCAGVNSGDSVIMLFEDEHNATYKSSGVVFTFVPKKVVEKFNISAGGGNRSYGNVTDPPFEASPSYWGMFRGNPKRTGFSNGTGDLQRDFQVAWDSPTGPGVFGSPAVADLNGDGKLEIVVPLEKNEGTPQKGLIVLDSNGNKLWDFVTRGAVYSSPAIGDLQGNGKLDVVFGTNGGELYALDGATGKEIWALDNHEGFFRSSPLIYDGDGDGDKEVYIGYNQGLYAFDGKSGIQEWNYTADGEISSSPAIGNLDADSGLELAFGSEHGFFYVLNAESGGLSWYLDLGSPVLYSTPAIMPDGAIAIGTDNGSLLVIKNQRVAASYFTNSSITGSPGVVTVNGKNLIIFGTAKEEDVQGAYQTDSSNGVYCIDESGNLIWRASTDGWGVFASPVLGDIDGDGRIEAVVGSRQGKLYVLNAETGALKWDYYDGTGIFASPVLADVDADKYLEMVVAYRFSNSVKLLSAPKKPDLIVDSVTFSNEFPVEGDKIGINATVKNIGKKAAGTFKLTVYRRSPILDYPLQNFTISSLQPGENKTLGFYWNAHFPYPPGKIGIYAKADSADEINESNELNNGKYKDFGNDLFFVNYNLPYLNYVATNVTTTASATVKNVGRLDLSGVKVGVFVGAAGARKELASTIVNINVSKEAVVNLTFTYVPSSATQKLAIVIDPNNTIAEVYEDNNVAETSVEPSNVAPAPPAPPPLSQGSTYNLPLIIIIAAVVVVFVVWKLKSPKKIKKKKDADDKIGKRLGEIKGVVESSDRGSTWQQGLGWTTPERASPGKFEGGDVGTEMEKPSWVDGATSESIPIRENSQSGKTALDRDGENYSGKENENASGDDDKNTEAKGTGLGGNAAPGESTDESTGVNSSKDDKEGSSASQ